MSKSEKMRYILARPARYDVNVHISVLEELLSALPDKAYLLMLREYAMQDNALLYKMVARFVPLTYAGCLDLVQGFIQDEKNGEDTITEDGETEVSKLADVLMQRAGNLQEVDEFIEAAELVFAVILAVEAEIPNVYDEGWTYQTILNEAFEFLNSMVEDPGIRRDEDEILEQLHELTLDVFESRDEEDSYYEDQFEDLLKVILVKIEEAN